MGEKRKTVLKIEGISNIKYEAADEFETSVSYEYYRQALEMTEEIVKNNFQIFGSEAEQSGLSGNDETILRNNKQLYNIIFFTGERGSGKTSTMLSYMEFLKDYFRKEKAGRIKNDNLKFSFEKQGVMFTGLEYIDASSLDEKEDILGTVLSKMLKKWLEEEKKTFGGIIKEYDYEHKKRKLQKLFSKVYEERRKLLCSDSILEEDSEMFMDNLKNMSLTFNLKNYFQELVISYLDIMKYPGAELLTVQSHFLVLCVDDLDMNITKGFQLLEQIRKYLMIPNVIILLSANYEQLNRVCNNHYFKAFDRTKSGDITTYIENLSREYLEKIIPVQRQIMMPSGEKWRLMQQQELQITYLNPQKLKYEKQGTLYSIVKEQLKESLGIDLETSGYSIQYLTPTTLRELCAWVIEIGHLNKEKKNYRENIEYFINGEFFRICRKYLNSDEQKYFIDAEKVGIESKLKIFYKVLYELCSETNREKVQTPKVGDVLELIAASQKQDLKAVMIASLVSIYLTLKLGKLLITDPNECWNELDRYYGTSLWGKWESKFFGNIIVVKDKVQWEIRNMAYREIGTIASLLSLNLEGEFSYDDETSIKSFLEKNKDKIINHQCILLFFDFENDINSARWIYNYKDKVLKLENGFGLKLCFSGFVKKLLTKRGLAFEFTDKLIDAMGVKNYFNKSNESQKDNLKNNLKEQLSINSLLKKTNKEKALLPLDNMEYMLKTAQMLQDNLEKNMAIPYDDFQIIIKQYFSLLQESLYKYDNKFKTRYRENFISCPVIKKMQEDDFTTQFKNCILSFIPEGKLGEDENWTGGFIKGI